MADEMRPGAGEDQVGDVAWLLPPTTAAVGGPPALVDRVPLPHYPPERHPVLVYLRSVQPSGRRSQASVRWREIVRRTVPNRVVGLPGRPGRAPSDPA